MPGELGTGAGDLRLIEGDGDHFVTSEVAHVTDFNGEIVARLPLDIERVVDGVGKLVGPIVSSKGNRLPLRIPAAIPCRDSCMRQVIV